MMAYDARSSPDANAPILLSNLQTNPGVALLTYQTQPLPLPFKDVLHVHLDVAVTLTVQTEQIDPITQLPNKTKALLTCHRAIFNAWQLRLPATRITFSRRPRADVLLP